MKTPDHIKKALELCGMLDGDCDNCPYDTAKIYCGDRLQKDALAYITDLEQRLAQADLERDELSLKNLFLKTSLESVMKEYTAVKRERDAAVHDVKSLCATNYFSGDFCEYCKYREADGQCFHDCMPYSSKWGWEWRGVCEENSKEDKT